MRCIYWHPPCDIHPTPYNNPAIYTLASGEFSRGEDALFWDRPRVVYHRLYFSIRRKDPDIYTLTLTLQIRWRKILVVVEGLYSMEGEICRLKEIVAVCKKSFPTLLPTLYALHPTLYALHPTLYTLRSAASRRLSLFARSHSPTPKTPTPNAKP